MMRRGPVSSATAGLLLGLMALWAVAAASGCGRRSDTGSQLGGTATGEPATGLPEAADIAPGTDAAEPVVAMEPPAPADGATEQTLADVMDAFAMPTSFVMTVEQADGEEPGLAGTKVAFQMHGATATRTREEAEGGKLIRIEDYEAGMFYQYSPADGTGYRMPLSDAQRQNPPRPHEACPPESRITGSETVDGVECWIVQPVEDDATTRLWLGKPDGLPRRGLTQEGTTRLRYSQIGQVPESAFRVPGNVELTDVSDATSGAQPDG